MTVNRLELNVALVVAIILAKLVLSKIAKLVFQILINALLVSQLIIYIIINAHSNNQLERNVKLVEIIKHVQNVLNQDAKHAIQI